MSAHANATQVGGTHYKSMRIQPWDAAFANVLLWPEGEIIKWVSRWKSKGGVNDLRKAEHLIAKMIYAAVNFDWPNRPLTDLELAQLMNLDVTPRDEPAGNYTATFDDGEVRVSPETKASAIGQLMLAVCKQGEAVDLLTMVLKAQPPAVTERQRLLFDMTQRAVTLALNATSACRTLMSIVEDAPNE